MDAITLLKEDHKTVEKLFKRFEKAGDRAYVEKREIVDRIIEELSKHAAIEEQLFYPVTRAPLIELANFRCGRWHPTISMVRTWRTR